MGFLHDMTFPRWVILTSLLASAVLGYYVYERSNRLEEIHRELDRTPGVVKRIQELGIQLNQLQEQRGGEALRGAGDQIDFETYIRSIAADPKVSVGQVRTSPTKRSPKSGYEDLMIKIVPANKDPRFTRSQIGNFLYKLESDSRRVKVTSLRLEPANRLKPGEIGDDEWTFDVTITVRSSIQQGTGAG